MCHNYFALSVFSENMGHPQPMRIVILKSVSNYREFMVIIFVFVFIFSRADMSYFTSLIRTTLEKMIHLDKSSSTWITLTQILVTMAALHWQIW